MYGKDTIAILNLSAGNSLKNSNAGVSDFTIDSATDVWSAIIRPEKTITIDQVAVLCVSITGAPAPLFRASLQGVTTAGVPDGTILGGGSPNSGTFTPVLGINWVTLSNSYGTTKNEDIALVIEDDAGGQAADSTHHASVRSRIFQFFTYGPPYVAQDTGGGYARQTDLTPSYGLRLASATDDVLGDPWQSHITADGAVSGANDISAMSVVISASFGRRVKIHGMQVSCFSAADFRVGIWDSTASPASVVVTRTLDEDISDTGQNNDCLVYWDGVWLDTGAQYYAGLETLSAASGYVYGTSYATDDSLSAVQGYPNNNLFTNTAGSWTKKTGVTAENLYLLVSAWDKHGEGLQHLDKGVIR